MKYFLISEVELNTLVDSSSHMLNDDISDAIRSRPLPAPALTPYECGDGCKGELLEQWRIEKYSDSMDLYLNGVFITKCKDMTSVNCVQNAIWQVAEKKARHAREEYDPLLDQCKSSLLRAIERSNELHKMAVDGGATPQNQGQFIALLETTIRDIESLRSTQQQAGDP